MYPAAFEYHAPTNVKDVLGLLGRYKDDAKLLAGGIAEAATRATQTAGIPARR